MRAPVAFRIREGREWSVVEGNDGRVGCRRRKGEEGNGQGWFRKLLVTEGSGGKVRGWIRAEERYGFLEDEQLIPSFREHLLHAHCVHKQWKTVSNLVEVKVKRDDWQESTEFCFGVISAVRGEYMIFCEHGRVSQSRPGMLAKSSQSQRVMLQLIPEG